MIQGTVATGNGPLKMRLQAVLSWADVVSTWSDASAVHAYRVSLDLREIIIASESCLEARHRRLTCIDNLRNRNLAVDGAACAIAWGQVESAIEILEQGRSMVLAQAGKYRTIVEELKVRDPTLASEFQAISTKMEASAMDTQRSRVELAFASSSGEQVNK